MMCKKKISVIIDPCVKMLLPHGPLVTGTIKSLIWAASQRPGWGYPGRCLPGAHESWASVASPRCPSGCVPMLSAQLSKPPQAPGERWILAGEPSFPNRAPEVQKSKSPREGSHSVKKAAHDTSKEKSCFPQCLFKRMGPSCSSHSTEKGTDLPALRSWELGANSALCRQTSTAASIFCLLTLVENWNLKKQVTRQNKTKQTAAMFHLWYTVHVCLPTLSSKKPLWIKSTNKTSYTIISLNRVVPGTVQRATHTVLNRMRDVEWKRFFFSGVRCLLYLLKINQLHFGVNGWIKKRHWRFISKYPTS